MSAMRDIFYVEVTDTFAGEANYSWVRRYKVHANTMRGAMLKVSRLLGVKAKRVMDTGDMHRYDFARSAVCAFVMGYTDEAERWPDVKTI
jgi:hypothetical protein